MNVELKSEQDESSMQRLTWLAIELSGPFAGERGQKKKATVGVFSGWRILVNIAISPFRLKSSSEQEDVKEGVSYCISIQENLQTGSSLECCIPRVMKKATEGL